MFQFVEGSQNRSHAAHRPVGADTFKCAEIDVGYPPISSAYDDGGPADNE